MDAASQSRQAAGSRHPRPGPDHAAASCPVTVPVDDQVGDQSAPPGLVGGAEPGAGVAMEVLVKQEKVTPGRVRLRTTVVAEHGAGAVAGAAEDADQAVGDLVGDLLQAHLPAASGGALERERIAEV